MPMQTGLLTGKLGKALVGAAAESAKKPVEIRGMIDLPPGINNGTARFDKFKLQEYKEGKNKGKLFFMATAVVTMPEFHEGKKCKGLQTRARVDLFPSADGKTTFAMRWNQMLDTVAACWSEDEADRNKLKAGIAGKTEQEVEQRLFAAFAAVEKAHREDPQAAIRFRTWVGSKRMAAEKGGKWWIVNCDSDGKPQFGARDVGPFASKDALKASPQGRYLDRDPLVNHDWQGRTQLVSPSVNGAAGHVQEDVPPPEDAEATADEAPAETPGETAETGAPSYDEAELGKLVAAADRDPECKTKAGQEANVKLQQIALAHGIDEDTFANAANCAEVADMIRAAAGGGEAPAEAGDEAPPDEETPAEDEAPPEEEPAAWVPAVDDEVSYQILDSGGKKVGKPFKCKVAKVDKRSKTCDLEAVKDKSKKYKGKKWDSPQITHD